PPSRTDNSNQAAWNRIRGQIEKGGRIRFRDTLGTHLATNQRSCPTLHRSISETLATPIPLCFRIPRASGYVCSGAGVIDPQDHQTTCAQRFRCQTIPWDLCLNSDK